MSASFLHRRPHFHRRYFLVHPLVPQAYPACIKRPLWYLVYYSLQWTQTQMYMLLPSSASCWTILFAPCYITTIFQSDTILSWCSQNVFINKSVLRHSIISMQWLVPWYLFTDIPIKLRPVTILKNIIIYDRVCRVKAQFPLWVVLHVPKYMKLLLKVPNSCYSKVTWQQIFLQNYSNTHNLRRPTELVDELLDTLHTIYLQFFLLFQPWGILSR